jgi:Fic family protein
LDAIDFKPSAPGRLVRGLQRQTAFVPHPLAPALRYEAPLVAALSAADRALGQLAGITRNLPNPKLLVRSFVTREAVLSSRIEGTQASLSDLFMFDVAPAVEQTVPDVREVANYVRALDHGIERLRKIPLTLNLIKEVHGILMDRVRGQQRRPGEFRRVQNWIGPHGCPIERARFVPPPPEELMACLSAFEKFINTPNDLPLLVRLAMIHYQFEAIHPFEDGNGRVGRLIISLLLESERAIPYPVLYLSAYFDRCRSEYYDRLLAVSNAGEWPEWVGFFVRGVTEQSIDAVERAGQLLALRDGWAKKCHKARMSALLLKLTDHLFRNPYINVPSVRAAFNIGAQSAQNLVYKLAELGIVREITGQLRNRIWMAPRIVEILEQSPAFDVSPSPRAESEAL